MAGSGDFCLCERPNRRILNSRYKNKDYVTVKDNEIGPLTRMGFVRAVIIGAAFTTMAAMAVMHNEKKRNAREDGK